jgi:NADH dehydrogenase [ubiquinone] 1 alpha subcomplex assembly factor 5
LAKRQHRTLVCDVTNLHKAEMEMAGQPPEIFDRQRRRALRDRAASQRNDSFLWHFVAAELTERLAMVSREFERVLIIGPMARYAMQILAERQCSISLCCLNPNEVVGAVVADEDRLPFDAASFDLIVAGGTLDSVNDLPGALVQIRHILKPDALFLGHMFGAGSLSTLKSLIIAADGDAAMPHIHPQIDLRSAADLLSRAGFALPVADGEMMKVRYSNWRSIVADVRAAGIGNALAGPRRYSGRGIFARLDAEWQRRAVETGKVEEYFAHLFVSGWAPSANQPKPARRGSGTVSLASVLPPAGA